jgi:hypothetical protein
MSDPASIELTRRQERKLKKSWMTNEQIVQFEQEMNSDAQRNTNHLLNKLDIKTTHTTATEQLKAEVINNASMDQVLDTYGIRGINKKRIQYLLDHGIYKRNPEMQRFEMIKNPLNNAERKKIENFNRRATKNSCKTLHTMAKYDEYNSERIHNENYADYVRRKAKQTELHPEQKQLIQIMWYVDHFDRNEAFEQDLTYDQVVSEMVEQWNRNLTTAEWMRQAQALEQKYLTTATWSTSNTSSTWSAVSNGSSTSTYSNGSPTARTWTVVKNGGLMWVVNKVLDYGNSTPNQRWAINTIAQVWVVGAGIYAGRKFISKLVSGQPLFWKEEETWSWSNRLQTLAAWGGIALGTSFAFGRNPFEVFNDLVFGWPTTQKIWDLRNQVSGAPSQAVQNLQSGYESVLTQNQTSNTEIQSTVISPLWTALLFDDCSVKDLVDNGIVSQDSGKLVCSLDRLKEYANKCMNNTPESILYQRWQNISWFISDAESRWISTDAMRTMMLSWLTTMGIGISTLNDSKSLDYGSKTINTYYSRYGNVITHFNTYLSWRWVQVANGVTSIQMQSTLSQFIVDGQLSDLDINTLIDQKILMVKPGQSWILDPIYQVNPEYLDIKEQQMLNVAKNSANQYLWITNKYDNQIKFDYEPNTHALYISRYGAKVQVYKKPDWLRYFGNFERWYTLPSAGPEFILWANLMCKIIDIYKGKWEQKPYFTYSGRTGYDIEFNKNNALDTEVLSSWYESNIEEIMPMISMYGVDFTQALNQLPCFDPGYTSNGTIFVNAPIVTTSSALPQTTPSPESITYIDPSDAVLWTSSLWLTTSDQKQLIQARKDINTKLDYTNHISNNIKFLCQWNKLLVAWAGAPIQIHKLPNGQRQLENFDIAFGPGQLSELLWVANLTWKYISHFTNQWTNVTPREISSALEPNTFNGRDIEFNHKDNNFNRASFETVATSAGRNGNLSTISPLLDTNKQVYVDRLNILPYWKNYSGSLPTTWLWLAPNLSTSPNPNTPQIPTSSVDVTKLSIREKEAYDLIKPLNWLTDTEKFAMITDLTDINKALWLENSRTEQIVFETSGNMLYVVSRGHRQQLLKDRWERAMSDFDRTFWSFEWQTNGFKEVLFASNLTNFFFEQYQWKSTAEKPWTTWWRRLWAYRFGVFPIDRNGFDLKFDGKGVLWNTLWKETTAVSWWWRWNLKIYSKTLNHHLDEYRDRLNAKWWWQT